MHRNWIAIAGLTLLTVATASHLELRANTLPAPSGGTALAQAQTVRVGAPAPQFTATDSNGKSHKLSDFKGKIVVLEWTNHQCPFVVKHYETGNMQTLQKEAVGKGVIWLSVVSSASGQQGFVNGQQANQLTRSRTASPTAVLLDPNGNLGRLYGARTTPHMFIIDSQGILRYVGAIDDKPTANKADAKTANNYVRPAINSLMSGQPVKSATTQPYGCSVKYGS
jgi:peroxiredoxin